MSTTSVVKNKTKKSHSKWNLMHLLRRRQFNLKFAMAMVTMQFEKFKYICMYLYTYSIFYFIFIIPQKRKKLQFVSVEIDINHCALFKFTTDHQFMV